MNIEPVFIGFDYANKSVLEDLAKNVQTLLSTPEGTVPGDRSFGISWKAVDMPGPVAENMLSLEIIQKIETYEPRLVASKVIFSHEEDGRLKASVELKPNKYYRMEGGTGDGE